MKECKYCAAQMEEESNFCPNCGKPWEEELPEVPEVSVSEETPVVEVTPAPEIKEGLKATPGKIAAAVVAVLLVIALLVGVVAMGTGSNKDTDEVPSDVVPAETAEAAQPTDLLAVEATIPADGNPEDVTCKGSYTADDETVLAAADTVVATMGDVQLTVSQLQVYYWLEVNNFLNTLYNYGMDASYYGMDYSLGLDQQICGIAEGLTWQQFFLDSALGSWTNYQSLALEAAENGYELEESYRTSLDNLKQELDVQAQNYGLADAEALLALNVGSVATLEDYRVFLENNYMGGGYLDSLVNQLNPTDAELEAYFTENEAAYNENGLTRELCSVDVRHILVFPEGADSTTIRTEEFPEEAWTAGEEKANGIYEMYLSGAMTEESFAALANEHSADPGSNTNGGLYTDVMQGDMVAEFDDWCFDPARQAGDTAVVRTSLGLHVMYFSGKTVLWPTYVLQDMQVEYQQELVLSAAEKHPVQVDYSAIVLNFMDLSA